MSDLIRIVNNTENRNALRPVEPRIEIVTRLATQDDFEWIDGLQKSESDQVGFQVEQAIRKRIEQGNLLVAFAKASADVADRADSDNHSVSSAQSVDSCPAGYCLGVDRYMKQDHVGIIYQMVVAPAYRRSLVAATLLQARFDTSAYGTKLYGCWCKQSLQANKFWEAMGFVPLAFRAAGRAALEKLKRREGDTAGGVHIYWQKRVRAGDVETPYWYPFETSGGAMMEGRVVLPLPPEMGWDEAAPVVLPGAERRAAEQKLLENQLDDVKCREREAKKANRPRKASRGGAERSGGHSPANACGAGVGAGGSKRVVSAGGFGFGVAPGFDPEAPEVKASQAAQAKEAEAQARAEAERLAAEKDAARRALKAAQRKNDPELVAYVRELRDRWREHLSAPGSELARQIEAKGRPRYDVSRVLADAASSAGERPALKLGQTRRLDAA